MLTAAIAASGSGDNTVVAGVTGKKIRVLAYHLSFSGTVNAKWKDGASADLTGLTYGAADVQVVAPLAPPRGPALSPAPYFEASAGNALVLNLSAGTAVGGWCCYDLAPV